MATSQNGWTVLERAPAAVVVPGTGGRPGTRAVRLPIRQGDVADVLVEVARRYHREVEPIDGPGTGGQPVDDWGWAYRPIRGKTSGFSNHASGTAIDLNATQHPHGVEETFTAREIAAVDRILADLRDPATGRPIVRWGERYTTTVDGMHFEIDAPTAAVGRVAARIRADRDPLEDLMALDPRARAALIADIAAAVPRTPVQLMSYVDGLYEDPNNQMPLGDLAQHAAAQAFAAKTTAAAARDEVAALRREIAELRALIAPPA